MTAWGWLLATGCVADDPVVLAFDEDFQWGAATAAHQIEGGNANNNWYQFETLDRYEGATVEASGDAARSYELYEADLGIAAGMGLGHFRLSVEWSRLEPTRDAWDEAEFEHYREVLEQARARGLEPSVTLHHFTEPIWVHDLSSEGCQDGPRDDDLCGWTNPEVAEEFAEFATEVADRYGELVDRWNTFNEPMVYLIGGYVFGAFPPGDVNLVTQDLLDDVVPVLVGLLDGHAGAYQGVHAADLADADGDGVAAEVGFTDAVVWFEPADPGEPDDVAAAEKAKAFYQYTFADPVIDGLFDHDLDGIADESHPEWAETCDVLGLQYYNRTFVVGVSGFPVLGGLPCERAIEEQYGLDPQDLGCPEIDDNDLTQMGYEHYPAGLRLAGAELAARYPATPLRITEQGIATRSGERRAQSIVRHLVELHALIAEGAPVDGYLHWSLIDNFEWAHGFGPRFGLFTVDYETSARLPTLGATIYADIVRHGGIRQSLLDTYAEGALAAEP